jgi:hypothetical protein
MDRITDIPVTGPNGNLIGKARLETKDDGVYAHITLRPELGNEMISAMTEGLVTGLSLAPEIMPVVRSSDEPFPSFYQGRADYGPGPSMVRLPLRTAHYPDQDLEG